ncbi:unnamed protein product [Cuscuta epithymum]|uniref:SWIM-type domain-containing protein n=1 Tax=Cuscuta epithymum TaxID=186058 RepID=A0AAV0FNZ2_9ASTE|nr:unnamed protein product [Cuscuta epithymum]
MSELKKNVGESDGSDLTFISDEHQSILRAVSIVFPLAEHRHCARHVYANWHKTHKGDELKMIFWKAVKAYNEADLNDALHEMEKVSPSAMVAFKACNPYVFCIAYVRRNIRCDVIVSNIVETFNGYTINARRYYGCLEAKNGDEKAGYGKSVAVICPRIMSEVSFQVSHYLDTLTINLESQSCTCRKWDLSDIPCCHAVSCMFFYQCSP